jgi:hypothetical protein
MTLAGFTVIGHFLRSKMYPLLEITATEKDPRIVTGALCDKDIASTAQKYLERHSAVITIFEGKAKKLSFLSKNIILCVTIIFFFSGRLFADYRLELGSFQYRLSESFILNLGHMEVGNRLMFSAGLCQFHIYDQPSENVAIFSGWANSMETNTLTFDRYISYWLPFGVTLYPFHYYNTGSDYYEDQLSVLSPSLFVTLYPVGYGRLRASRGTEAYFFNHRIEAGFDLTLFLPYSYVKLTAGYSLWRGYDFSIDLYGSSSVAGYEEFSLPLRHGVYFSASVGFLSAMNIRRYIARSENSKYQRKIDSYQGVLARYQKDRKPRRLDELTTLLRDLSIVDMVPRVHAISDTTILRYLFKSDISNTELRTISLEHLKKLRVDAILSDHHVLSVSDISDTVTLNNIVQKTQNYPMQTAQLAHDKLKSIRFELFLNTHNVSSVREINDTVALKSLLGNLDDFPSGIDTEVDKHFRDVRLRNILNMYGAQKIEEVLDTTILREVALLAQDLPFGSAEIVDKHLRDVRLRNILNMYGAQKIEEIGDTSILREVALLAQDLPFGSAEVVDKHLRDVRLRNILNMYGAQKIEEIGDTSILREVALLAQDLPFGSAEVVDKHLRDVRLKKILDRYRVQKIEELEDTTALKSIIANADYLPGRVEDDAKKTLREVNLSIVLKFHSTAIQTIDYAYHGDAVICGGKFSGGGGVFYGVDSSNYLTTLFNMSFPFRMHQSGFGLDKSYTIKDSIVIIGFDGCFIPSPRGVPFKMDEAAGYVVSGALKILGGPYANALGITWVFRERTLFLVGEKYYLAKGGGRIYFGPDKLTVKDLFLLKSDEALRLLK